MTNYYVDSNSGDNGDNGTTQALAFDTLLYALASGGLAGTDNIIWVRRTHSELPGANIEAVPDGAPETPMRIIGWPRPAIPNTTITGADFTNGSTVIDNVAGITPGRGSHVGRYITGPDGEEYMITAILWEAGVDGMAGGAEFTVGEYANNTTQTKKGKIYGFTDDADNTGTIQYARDSSSAWVEDDNITDDDGGDAEIEAGGETAVGFIIDREYSGGTVTGTDGKFQIEADEDWADRPADVDGWDADAIALPIIDFNDGNFNINIYYSDYAYAFKNLEIKDSTDSGGIVRLSGGGDHTIQGCLLKQTVQDDCIVYISAAKGRIIRSIIEGSGAGTSQRGIFFTSNSAGYLKDVAIYNCGDNAILLRSAFVFIENVNCGIEIENGDEEIINEGTSLAGSINISGRGLRLGGKAGYISIPANTNSNQIYSFENYDKVLGAHKAWYPGGTYEKALVTGATTPNKKVSDNVIKISPNVSGFRFLYGIEIFCHEFEATTDAKTYKYWLFNDTGDTLNDSDAKGSIWLELEYVSAYDDTSEYVIKKEYSAEDDIADNGGDTDWDYLQVGAITPAVVSKVRIKCFCRHYTAAGDIFIDPAVVIS